MGGKLNIAIFPKPIYILPWVNAEEEFPCSLPLFGRPSLHSPPQAPRPLLTLCRGRGPDLVMALQVRRKRRLFKLLWVLLLG